MSEADEVTAVSYAVYGKTADEWWAVWDRLCAVRAEICERARRARDTWRTSLSEARDQRDQLWDAYRDVQREYDLMSASVDVAYALHTMARYEVDDILIEFIN